MSMFLKDISIVNFKSFEEKELQFCSNINCIIGDNGVGKTNILDAIYHLSMCKSYFTQQDRQCIRNGEDFYVVQGEYDIDGKSEKIYCGLHRDERHKSFRRNGAEYQRLSDHIGLIPIVFSSPTDTILIFDSDARRKFVDSIISQFDSIYLKSLAMYKRALEHRNTLLHKLHDGFSVNDAEFEIWDMQLADYGTKKIESGVTYQMKLNANKKPVKVDKSKKGMAKNLENSYNAAFQRLSAIHDVKVCNLRHYDVQPVIEQSRHMSRSTIHNMLIVCRMVAAYAQKAEYTTTDFSAYLDGDYKDPEGIHRPFTIEEIKRLWKDKHETAARFALITIYTGLRPSELLQASVSASDITRGYFIAGSKTAAGRGRKVPVHPDIKPMMMELAMESKDGHLFDTLSLPVFRRRYWDEYMKNACMEHLPHDGRHTCATLMEAAGVPLVRRKLILGHAVKDITDGTYTHVSIEELISEISKICIL